MILNASNPNSASEKLLKLNRLYIASQSNNYNADVGFNTVYACNSAQTTSLTLLQESTHTLSIPSSGMNMLISSNSSDDNSTGIGCRSVYVEGLNNSLDRINETVNTNGTTPVATTSFFSKINRLVALTAGGERCNIGTIFCGSGTVTAGKPENIYSCMIPDSGFSKQAIVSLPRIYFPLLMQCTCYAGTGREVEFTVLGKFPNSGWVETFKFGAYQGVSKVDFTIAGVFYDNIDIKVNARCLTSGQTVNVFFLSEFVLIKNSFL